MNLSLMKVARAVSQIVIIHAKCSNLQLNYCQCAAPLTKMLLPLRQFFQVHIKKETINNRSAISPSYTVSYRYKQGSRQE